MTWWSSVEHSVSGTPHSSAAARTSINRAVAPASRSGRKKLTTECEPSVSWSPYFSAPIACTTFTRAQSASNSSATMRGNEVRTPFPISERCATTYAVRPCRSPGRRRVAAELSPKEEMDRLLRRQWRPRKSCPARGKRQVQTRQLPAVLSKNPAGHLPLPIGFSTYFRLESCSLRSLSVYSAGHSLEASYRQCGYLQAPVTARFAPAAGEALVLWPGAQSAAQVHELAEVIRIVVCQYQRFPQNRLALAMRYFSEEIGLRVLHQADHILQIPLECRDAFLPGFLVGGDRRFGPVSRWKRRGDVLGISAELEDVPLREPRMFEQLPARVRKRVREGSIFPRREIVESIHEMDVRASALEQVHDLLAQFAIRVASGLRRSFSCFWFCSFFACLFLFHSGFPVIRTC